MADTMDATKLTLTTKDVIAVVVAAVIMAGAVWRSEMRTDTLSNEVKTRFELLETNNKLDTQRRITALELSVTDLKRQGEESNELLKAMSRDLRSLSDRTSGARR